MTPPARDRVRPNAQTEPESTAPPRLSDLGDLQLAVMRILWKRGQATVHETLAEFPPERRPAYTTVLTVLRNLEKRGLVTHNAPNGSRTFTYRPNLSRQETYAGILQDLLDRLFDGSPAALIAHLLESQPIGPEEWTALAEIIASRAKSLSPVS